MDIQDIAEPSYLIALSAVLLDLQPMQAIRAIFALRCFTVKLSIHTDSHDNQNVTALLNQFADWLDRIEAQIAPTTQNARARAISSVMEANQDDSFK